MHSRAVSPLQADQEEREGAAAAEDGAHGMSAGLCELIRAEVGRAEGVATAGHHTCPHPCCSPGPEGARVLIVDGEGMRKGVDGR